MKLADRLGVAVLMHHVPLPDNQFKHLWSTLWT